MLAQAVMLGLSEEWFNQATPFLALEVMDEIVQTKYGEQKPTKRKATTQEVASFITK